MPRRSEAQPPLESPHSRRPCRHLSAHGNNGDEPMGWRIGVDIGGTFTDVAVLDEGGRSGGNRQGVDGLRTISGRPSSREPGPRWTSTASIPRSVTLLSRAVASRLR